MRDNPLFPLILVAYLIFLFIGYRVYKELVTVIGGIPRRFAFVGTVWHWFVKTSNHGIIDVDGFSAAYSRFITRVLHDPASRKRVVVAIVAYSLFSFALLPLGLVKNEFFPKTGEDRFFLTLQMPTTSPACEYYFHNFFILLFS
jgi:hypothetical protein